MLVVGDKDIKQNGFSVRSRKHGNLGLMDLNSLAGHIQGDLDQGKPKYIFGE